MPTTYKLYKGLQRPLVFKMFKGRYIYWAGSALVITIALAIIISATIGSLFGLITLAVLGGGSLMYVINKQKSGLYKKTTSNATFIMHSIKYRTSKKTKMKFT